MGDTGVVRGPEIRVPATETRQHRYVTLKNGVRAILVSDAQADRAAAALSARVGFHQDPVDLPGLQHFNEHLLFLGSAKYPEPDSFNAYVSARGGHTNAYTTGEETVYYFTMNASSKKGPAAKEGNGTAAAEKDGEGKEEDEEEDPVERALDMFAGFFTAPLFDGEYVERERLAVDSEHRKNLQNDAWRRMQLVKETSSRDPLANPFGKFGTGSAETLGGGDDLRREVIRAHARGYKPAAMTLCFVAPLPLDRLEELVVGTGFGDIHGGIATSALGISADEPLDSARGAADDPYGGGTPPGTVPPGPVFGPGDLGIVVKYAPRKMTHRVELVWELPSQVGKWRSKPTSYLSHLLGHEGPGSLLSSLKARGLADELEAGVGHSADYFALFGVTVFTPEGAHERWREIAESVFAYIDLVEREGIREWIHEECRGIAEANFRFRERSAPARYAGFVAPSMHHFPPEEVLAANALHYDFSEGDIREVLAVLRDRSRVRVHLCDPDLEPAEADPAARTEPIYGVRYTVEPIGEGTAAAWNARAEDIVPALAIPPPNPFIATDFEEIGPDGGWRDGDAEDASVGGGGSGSGKTSLRDTLLAEIDATPGAVEPTVAARSERTVVWHLPDTRWRRPKGDVRARFLCPQSYANPRDTVLTKLLVMCVEDALTEVSYDAELAGLQYSLRAAQDGLHMRFHGYRHKLLVFVREVLSRLAGSDVSAARFPLLQAQLVRDLRNTARDEPFRRAMYEHDVVLTTPRWHIDEYLAVAEAVTAAEVAAHRRAVLADGRLEVLVHGNGIDGGEVLRAFEAELGQFRPLSDAAVAAARQRAVALRRGERVVLRVRNGNEDEENRAVMLSYIAVPDGREDFATAARVAIIGDALSTPAFRQLRTEEQLGYTVFAMRRLPLSNVNTLSFIVQSHEHPVPHLRARIENFVRAAARGEVDGFDTTSIADHIAGLVRKKLERDATRSAECSRVWSAILASGDRVAASPGEPGREDLSQVSFGERKVFDRSRRVARAAAEVDPEDALSFFRALIADAPGGTVAVHAVNAHDFESQSIADDAPGEDDVGDLSQFRNAHGKMPAF